MKWEKKKKRNKEKKKKREKEKKKNKTKTRQTQDNNKTQTRQKRMAVEDKAHSPPTWLLVTFLWNSDHMQSYGFLERK